MDTKTTPKWTRTNCLSFDRQPVRTFGKSEDKGRLRRNAVHIWLDPTKQNQWNLVFTFHCILISKRHVNGYGNLYFSNSQIIDGIIYALKSILSTNWDAYCLGYLYWDLSAEQSGARCDMTWSCKWQLELNLRPSRDLMQDYVVLIIVAQLVWVPCYYIVPTAMHREAVSVNKPRCCKRGGWYTSVTSEQNGTQLLLHHDNVIKWKHFPHYWPFVRLIHRSPVNSPSKGRWCFFDLRLYKRLSKQFRWWFETSSRSLWRHYYDKYFIRNGRWIADAITCPRPWLWTILHCAFCSTETIFWLGIYIYPNLATYCDTPEIPGVLYMADTPATATDYLCVDITKCIYQDSCFSLHPILFWIMLYKTSPFCFLKSTWYSNIFESIVKRPSSTRRTPRNRRSMLCHFTHFKKINKIWSNNLIQVFYYNMYQRGN